MNPRIAFSLNRASEAEIAEHLTRCDAHFVPALSGRVEIDAYAHKIFAKALRFEAWARGALVGLVASYCGDNKGDAAYITSVSVLPEWQSNGIASQLLTRCIGHVSELGVGSVELEVDGRNAGAMTLYRGKGFRERSVLDLSVIMQLDIRKDV